MKPVTVSVKLDADMYKALRDLAAIEGRTASEVVRFALASAFLKNRPKIAALQAAREAA